jgi:hypothetical protein
MKVADGMGGLGSNDELENLKKNQRKLKRDLEEKELEIEALRRQLKG